MLVNKGTCRIMLGVVCIAGGRAGGPSHVRSRRREGEGERKRKGREDEIRERVGRPERRYSESYITRKGRMGGEIRGRVGQGWARQPEECGKLGGRLQYNKGLTAVH